MPPPDEEHRFRTSLGQAREILEAMRGNPDGNDYHFGGSDSDWTAVQQQLRFVEANVDVAAARAARAQTPEGAREILANLRSGVAFDNVSLNDVVFRIGADHALLAAWAYDHEYLRVEVASGRPAFSTIESGLEGATRNSLSGTRCFGEYIYAAEGAKFDAGNYVNLLAATLVEPVAAEQVDDLVGRLEALGDAGGAKDGGAALGESGDAGSRLDVNPALVELERQRLAELERIRLEEEARQQREAELLQQQRSQH